MASNMTCFGIRVVLELDPHAAPAAVGERRRGCHLNENSEFSLHLSGRDFFAYPPAGGWVRSASSRTRSSSSPRERRRQIRIGRSRPARPPTALGLVDGMPSFVGPGPRRSDRLGTRSLGPPCRFVDFEYDAGHYARVVLSPVAKCKVAAVPVLRTAFGGNRCFRPGSRLEGADYTVAGFDGFQLCKVSDRKTAFLACGAGY